MHVTAEPEGDPVYRDGEWRITAHVTVRMSGAEYLSIDGLRFEAFPWIRFRLKLRKEPGETPGAWRYEVHDAQSSTDASAVVSSGVCPWWDMALTVGQDALRDARRAAPDEEQQAAASRPWPTSS